MFVGEKEIKSVKDGLVEYKDGTSEKYSEAYAKYFTTEEAKNPDDFRIFKTHKLISDIMRLFVESNSNMNEITAIFDGLVASVENAKDEAICKLFKEEDAGNINFKHINDIVLGKK